MQIPSRLSSVLLLPGIVFGLVFVVQAAKAIPNPPESPVASGNDNAGLVWVYEEAVPQIFSNALTPELQQKAISIIRDQFAENIEVLSSASVAEFQRAVLAADYLDVADEEQIRIFLKWINTTKTLPKANSSELNYLLDFLRLTADEMNHKPEMEEHLVQANSKLFLAIRDHISKLEHNAWSRWEVLATCVLARDTLAYDKCSQRDEIIKVISNGTISARLMDVGGMAADGLLRVIGISSASEAIYRNWINHSTNWSKLSPYRLARVYSSLGLQADEEPWAAEVRALILKRSSRDLTQLSALLIVLSESSDELIDPMLDSHFQSELRWRGISDELFQRAVVYMEQRHGKDQGRLKLYGQLARVMDRDSGIEGKLADLALSELLARYKTASPEMQPLVWKEGLQRLAVVRTLWISTDTLAELDSVLQKSSEAERSQVINMLTDLMLLAPDPASMRRLQWRRAAMFRHQSGGESNALCAATFDVLLAMLTNDGPGAAISHRDTILQSMNMTEDDREDQYTLMKNIVLAANASGSAEPKMLSLSHDQMIDPLLAHAATEALADESRSKHLRRKAFLNLYAGQMEKALQQIHQAWRKSLVDDQAATEGLHDVALVIAVSTGQGHNMHQFTKWIAMGGNEQATENSPASPVLQQLIQWESQAKESEPEQSTAVAPENIATRILSRHVDQIWAWGTQAMVDRSATWAQGYYARAIDLEANDDGMARLRDRIRQSGPTWREMAAADKSSEAAQVIKAVASDTAEVEARFYLLGELAAIHLTQQQFTNALEILDQAAMLPVSQEVQQDMAIGFTHVLALIRVERSDEALATLAQMEGWSGSSDEHARVLFLSAWIHLKHNHPEQAIPFLKRVTKDYGETEFAEQARKLLSRIG